MYLKDYSVSPLLTQLITDNGGYKVKYINMSRDTQFPTIWHFDKCRLR